VNFQNPGKKNVNTLLKRNWFLTLFALGLVLLVGAADTLSAQDIQYSQFYANPIYLNPAFTGAAEASRFGVNYRNQWPGLHQSIHSTSASFDTHLPQINSNLSWLKVDIWLNSAIGVALMRNEKQTVKFH
jgi:type IX secretion system PorP/SprF family membrane protein